MLKEFFKSISFTSLLLDLKVFTNGKVIVSGLTLAIYVDDLLITREYEKDIVHVKKLLKAQFKVKDLEEAEVVLDILIMRYNE